MSYWHEEPLHRRDGVTVPTIGITVVLSLLLHAAVIWQWKFSLHAPGPDKDIKPPLTVQLERLPGPPPSPGADIAHAERPRTPLAAPQPRAEPRTAAPGAPPASPPVTPPPVIAMETPAPEAAPSVPARTPSTIDFAASVEAQRRARGESSSAPAAAPTAEDANARATRQAIANLAMPRTPAFGQDPSRSGGVFQLRHNNRIDYAEFRFNGWHSEARRNWAQDITVRKGNHPSIELAVVREMIDIIRRYEQGDFPWYSHRMNRTVTLSARPRDSAGLEEFLMREFFFNPRIAP